MAGRGGLVGVMEEKERLKRLILAAQGRLECDLVLKNGFVLDVFTGDILLGDVGIIEGRIAGVGRNYRGKEELDLSGMFLSPGFIDAHMHVESTMLIPSRLSKYLLLHGTTTIVTDPHEIANVLGLEGIMAMIEDGEKGSIDYFFTAPSCVPATQNETSGATIGIEELRKLSKHEKVVGLSEVMDFLSVLRGDEDVLEKLLLFRSRHGHAPLLGGPELMGYVASGIDSDHETVSFKEGLHKLRAGVFLMIRNGSSAKNLEELLPLVDKNSLFRCCLVTDDLCPKDILDFGHLDHLLKRSMELGLDPISAYRLVTICPASYLGFRDRGAISPGKMADLVVLRDLREVEIYGVVKGGRFLRSEEVQELPYWGGGLSDLTNSVNFKPFFTDDLKIPLKAENIRVISLIPNQIVTEAITIKASSHGGYVVSDRERDILKCVVVERHRATGNMGKGFVHGFGLKSGAIGSSIAHDAHNIVCIGVDDESIFSAINRLRELRGGIVYAIGSEVVAELGLPYAGLMCDLELEDLVKRQMYLEECLSRNGCKLDSPIMSLSFLALSVIPKLKLTDKGLVDVERGSIIDLFQ